MSLQQEIRMGYRSQAEIDREMRGDRLNDLLSALAAEINSMRSLPFDECSADEMEVLAASLRHLLDLTQVADKALVTPLNKAEEP